MVILVLKKLSLSEKEEEFKKITCQLFVLQIVYCLLIISRSNFSAISWREQVNFHWDDEVRFVLDQHSELYFIVLAN